MKFNKLTAILLLLGLATSTYAQKAYMRDKKLGILDSLTYEKNKEAYKVQFADLLKQGKLDENLEIVRKTKDSIIYDYNWVFNFSKNNTNSTQAVVDRSEQFKLFSQKLQAAQLKTIDGKNFNVKSLNGKPTLLNFWFTKCAPCIDEMPALNSLMKKYKGRINFVAITYNNTAEVKEFLKKHNYDFIQIVDAKNFTDALEIKSYPKNVFMDKKGNVTKITGGVPYTLNEKKEFVIGGTEVFEKIIDKLL